ncbi:MAG: hypothetical protein JWO76_2404 [Nocardioides sp.]|nr:hypothetical protein [Nocardioides sp.]
MASWRAGVLLVALAVAGCSTGPHHGGVTVGVSPVQEGGPLEALSGEGSLTVPSPGGGQLTATYTFGTVVCSEDADADIVIDRVSYQSSPVLPTTEDSETSKPSIGTWLRQVPPPSSPGALDNTPVGSVEGGAEGLPGEVAPIGDGYPVPVEHTCHGYSAPDRTWPITELLTVVTADSRGGIATKTVIEYHEGNNRYTRTIDWKVGVCGTRAPHGLGCGHPH